LDAQLRFEKNVEEASVRMQLGLDFGAGGKGPVEYAAEQERDYELGLDYGSLVESLESANEVD
jgi:hypothetical protein